MKYADEKEFDKANVFGKAEPNSAYACFFRGNSYLNPITGKKTDMHLSNVTFEPGCRNNWHIHHAKRGGGQILICTAGEGWYQEAGQPAVSLTEGTVIEIPANVKHWLCKAFNLFEKIFHDFLRNNTGMEKVSTYQSNITRLQKNISKGIELLLRQNFLFVGRKS